MLANISALTLFAGLAAAIHEPVGEPSGNPFHSPLSEIVKACKPYEITWTPTTPNKVSIRLLRGPSENVQPLGAPLVEGIANTGSFMWTPAGSLEADTTHYGLQIIDDVNGQYQWSNQFGISTSECKDEPAASSTKGYDAPKPSSSKKDGYEAPSSTVAPTSTKGGYQAPATTSVQSVASTGAPGLNSTTLVGTKSLTVPVSLKTSTTAAPPSGTTSTGLPIATGAAAGVRAGLGLVGVVAGMVFVL